MKNIKLIEPKAEKIHTSLSTHNDERIDEYYWLKERDNPKVIDYLNAENSYRDKYMKDYQSLEKKLFEEIKSRIKEDDSSVPYFENGYFYYTRYETGKQYPIYCRKKENLDANEEILIDANKMSKGHDYFRIGGIDVSPNNKIAAYGVDTVSRRLYTIYFKNLETGEDFFAGYAVGVSLMLFYAFAMQCMTTIAVVYRETKSLKWPLIQLLYMTALAYISSLIAYNLLS